MTSLLNLQKKKDAGQKISMVTCYDHWSAKILKKTNVDCLLIGDSVAMVVHGFDSTVHATTEMMVTHTRAVARAQTEKPIITDLPFLAHRKGLTELMNAADQLMKAGAHALKIEAAPGQENEVRHLVQSGIPVVGHLGLTPQYVHQFGGYKVQGRDEETFKSILDHAKALEDVGCQLLVVECVPNTLAAAIQQKVDCPVIGIGAGAAVDGQVLVLQDLLGFNEDFQPRFVRHFASGERWMQKALNEFTNATAELSFPNEKESFQ